MESCIYPNPCFPCIVNRTINDILEKAVRENRSPSDYELEQAHILQKAMSADIQERALRRSNMMFILQAGGLI
jgi:hypothetical protein